MKILSSGFNLDEFFRKLHKTKSLLMLDYDGTLAPFVKERMQAYPYPGVKERLLELVKLKRSRIVIVSGRSLKELEILLDSLDLELWGSHGLERKLTNGSRVYASVSSNTRNGLEKGISICKKNLNPENYEVKPYAVALHWRGIAEKEKEQMLKLVEIPWNQICSDYDFEIHHFDGGIELRPKGKNKGNVIREFFNELSEDTTIACLGDDLTDEEAFAALCERGLKVLVREELHPTLADIQLVPPKDLLAFLDRWRDSYEK